MKNSTLSTLTLITALVHLKQKKARKEKERAQRIQKAKGNGQLLTFPPHNPTSTTTDTAPPPPQTQSPTEATKQQLHQKQTHLSENDSNSKKSTDSNAEDLSTEAGKDQNEAKKSKHKEEKELLAETSDSRQANELLRAQYAELLQRHHAEKEEFKEKLAVTSKKLSEKEKEWEATKTKLETETKYKDDRIQEMKNAQEDLLQKKDREIEAIKEAHRGEIETITQEKDVVIAASEGQYENILKEKNALLKKLALYEQKLRDEDTSKAAPEEKLLQERKNKDILEEKLKETVKENNQLDDDIAEMNLKLEQEHLNLCILQSKEAEVTADNPKLVENLSVKNQIIKKITGELSDTKEQLDPVTAKLSVAVSISDSEVSLSISDSEVSELKELKEQKGSLEGQLEKASAGQLEAEKKLKDSVEELEMTKKAKDNAEEQWRNLNSSLEKLEKDLEAEKEKNVKIQSKIDEQTLLRANEVDVLKEKLAVTEKHLSATQTELENINAERDEAIKRCKLSDGRELALQSKLVTLEEMRCALHNRVMQLSGNIRVLVRVRPLIQAEIDMIAKKNGKKNSRCMSKAPTSAENVEECPFHFPGIDYHNGPPSSTAASSSTSSSSTFTDDISKNLLEVTEPFKDHSGFKNRRKKWKFSFNHVFSPTHTQEDVWSAAEPLIQSTIDGFNVCIFSYGQTGSGKTYTMLGNDENPGITARSVRRLFDAKQEIEAASNGASSVHISVELLEIYNEKVRDLLVGPSTEKPNLKVNSNKAVGNVLVSAANEGEAGEILSLAQSRRCVKATQINSESSRGHLLFTIHFQVKSTNSKGINRYGKLHVVDLAGGERINKSGSHGGALLEEAKHINMSLTTLSNVIEKLQNKESHIPYLDSKLTYLLQNSLGGDSKTAAIICCSPLSAHFNESLSSLRFAAKVSRVELKAEHNFSY